MNHPNTIKIDQVEYIRADSVPTKPTKKQIVVLQRGWVAVGDVCKEGATVTITNCSIIRTWGTTKGLGEIATNGPTNKTVLDPCEPISVHELGIVFSMNVVEKNWK